MANGMMYSMLTIHREAESSQCRCNSCTEKGEDDSSSTDEKLPKKIIEHLALQYHLSKGGEHCGQIERNQAKKKKTKKTRRTKNQEERLQALEEEISHLRLCVLSDDSSNSEWSSDNEYDDDTISEWSDRVYKNAGAYNYAKREEQIVVTTSKEQATKNALQLIRSEEMMKKKAEKKREKKKRQKEKKKSEKVDEDPRERKSTISSTTSSENVSTNRLVKGKDPVPSDDENAEVSADEKPISDEEDFLDANAAFVKIAVKQNSKISSPAKVFVDQSEKSTATKKVKCLKPSVNKPLLSSDSLGTRGYQFAINNKLQEAIDSLNEAIFLEPGDIRHYVNRSYCYLRIGHFSLALIDAQFVMKNATFNAALAKAACRAGQSYYGLEDYAKAEKSFEESISLDGGNLQVYRELMRVRVAQLTSMGFAEKHALRALQKTATVMDAVTFLTSDEVNTNDVTGDSDSESECEDAIYRSDDEDTPSNTKELTNLTASRAYITNSPKNKYTQHLVPDTHLLGGIGTKMTPSSFKNDVSNINGTNSVTLSNTYSKLVQNMSTTSNGIYSNGAMRKVPPSNPNSRILVTTYTAQQEKRVNPKAIWIGNISDKISDSKIEQVFSKFGPIESMKRHPEKPCMFINYKSQTAASQAIANMNGVEINGMKLPVKTATISDK